MKIEKTFVKLIRRTNRRGSLLNGSIAKWNSSLANLFKNLLGNANIFISHGENFGDSHLRAVRKIWSTVKFLWQCDLEQFISISGCWKENRYSAYAVWPTDATKYALFYWEKWPLIYLTTDQCFQRWNLLKRLTQKLHSFDFAMERDILKLLTWNSKV